MKLFLVQDDVDKDSKDSNGQTPLSWAAKKWHEAVVKLFRAQDDVDADSKVSTGQRRNHSHTATIDLDNRS